MPTPHWLSALQNPGSFPHPVAGFKLLHTHISWVLLTGDYVYKFKKPVNLGFLDFSTLERRQYYCAEELRLNRRLAPELYLDVVPVVWDASTGKPKIGGTGSPFEYAVRMRQFDPSDGLDQRVTQGELTPQYLDPLAKQLAQFHDQVPRAPNNSTWGRPENILGQAQDNFQVLAVYFRDYPDYLEVLESQRQDTIHQYKALQEQLQQRQADGWIRECHGDLHFGNLVRYQGHPLAFDCIEFNPDLRWIDVQSELAFLYMDACARRVPGFGRRFLNIYLEQTGDYAGLTVQRFYQAYRAMVRAKVAALRHQQESPGDNALAPEVLRYVDLASAIRTAARPYLILAHGLSGSGKTYQSWGLIEQLGVVRLRSDVERKRLYGLNQNERPDPKMLPLLYGEQANQQTHDHLAKLTDLLLTAGWPVFVDATFLQHQQRQRFQEIANNCAVPWVIMDFQAPESVLKRRIQARSTAGVDASDADLRVLEAQLAQFQPLHADEKDHTITVDTTLLMASVELSQRVLNHFGGDFVSQPWMW